MYNLAQENSHSPSSIQTNDQTRSLGCDYDNELYYLYASFKWLKPHISCNNA